MTILQLIKRLYPFLKPYRSLILFSFFITLIGAGLAQVNPLVVKYTVNSIQKLLSEGKGLTDGIDVMILITAILLSNRLVLTIKNNQLAR